MSRRRVERGRALEELVKGSLDYTIYIIRKAFWKQFGDLRSDDYYLWIEETFEDHVIVKDDRLPADEFYYVTYTRGGETITFAEREDWEIVQLTYHVNESRRGRGKENRLEERFEGAVRLLDEDAGNTAGPWRIQGVGVTAGVVNANGRRYRGFVLDEAIRDLKDHLHESAGQGRVFQLYGESEHPSIKASRRPYLTEVVINWDSVQFDGRQILLEGNLLGTSTGRDIRAQMLGGVVPGISQRAYGGSHVVEEDGQQIEEVEWLVITGYDLTVEPSDPAAGVTMFESRQKERQEGFEMELNLEMLREKYPELVAKLLAEHDEERRAEIEKVLQAKQLEEERLQKALAERQAKLREKLGLTETDDLEAALEERDQRLADLEAKEQARQVAAYIEEQTKELKYPDFLKTRMVEAIQATAPKTIEEAKAAIVAKRKEYDAIMADLELKAKGRGGVQVLGPVLESETGTPAFARASFQLEETIRRVDLRQRWDPRKPRNVNEEYARLYLERFDQVFKTQLLQEARLFEEAEQSSDLNIPYSVSRAIVAEAFPQLVATSVFDFGTVDQATFRLYFETYAGETGYTGTVTDESVTADHDTYVAMDYKRVTPGTVVVTNSGGGTTYTEGTDYVVDYANGKLMALSTGSITDSQALLVDYQYTAVRKGEMAAIERGKMTLSYVTVDAAADRLAAQISSEAITFSRSQLGWDAVARTLASLVRQVQRKVDQGVLYMALASALKTANNSGGTWDSSNDSEGDLVKLLGLAKVKVHNRYYEPTSFLMSVTNGDRLSNWEGFKRDGFPDAVLNANGFVGRVKGLPAFQSTEFSDSYNLVVNRELVMYRVYMPMVLKGPYPSYDVSGGTSKLIAADQYYAEEYNATESPVPEKGAYINVI